MFQKIDKHFFILFTQVGYALLMYFGLNSFYYNFNIQYEVKTK